MKAIMSDHHGAAQQPPGYRLISEEMLSFLWFQTAARTLEEFGIPGVNPTTYAQRLDCIRRLGTLYLKHSDVLTEDAALVVDLLMQVADDQPH